MLNNKQTRLLTALVDGELSSRQEKTAFRLLKKSAEARDLFKKLKGDSEKLRSLPRTQLPKEFTTKLLREIIKLDKPAPVAQPDIPLLEPPPPASFPTWLGFTIAGLALAAITISSFLFFSYWN